MHDTIYDKTAKGRDEISTRHAGLPSRMRTLLVLVDGKTGVDSLLKNVAGLGLGPPHLDELREQGFIVARIEEPPAVSEAEPPASSSLLASSSPPAPDSGVSAPSENADRFQAVYHFYNETIRSNLGLRGLPLQLKVEKAATVDALRALRDPYLEAILRAKGPEAAQGLCERLDGLLASPRAPTRENPDVPPA